MKYPDSDAAVQIAEEAFRAGYEAASGDDELNWYRAWSDFEPSEACKDLVRSPGTVILPGDKEWEFPYGMGVHIFQKRPDVPAFPGYVIGSYERTDGPRGYVLQHERDRIVHVYSEAVVERGLNL